MREEDMLENNSYWDIDVLEEHNAPIRKKILKWENWKPKTLIGKLWKRFRILSLRKKLHHYK